jgi:hypothetical protein
MIVGGKGGFSSDFLLHYGRFIFRVFSSREESLLTLLIMLDMVIKQVL